MRYAVVDLGSNTFHLLICDLNLSNGSFIEVFRKRSFVYISQGNIQQLSDQALARANNAVKLMGALCQAYEVNEIKVFGTAAFRQAKNINTVHNAARVFLGADIEVLSGKQEADYILRGVSWTINSGSDPYLVMDIGGGSVEYIYVKGTEISRCSINYGISVLRSDWHREDPPTSADLDQLNESLGEALIGFNVSDAEPPSLLIGSSGPFEIFEAMLEKTYLERAEVEACIAQILSSNHTQRKNLKGMPESRADLSLESVAVVSQVLRRYPSIAHIQVSPYGIKEGFIRERLNLD